MSLIDDKPLDPDDGEEGESQCPLCGIWVPRGGAEGCRDPLCPMQGDET